MTDTASEIAYRCPSCYRKATFPAELLGKPITCPNCRIPGMLHHPGTDLPGFPSTRTTRRVAAGEALAAPIEENGPRHESRVHFRCSQCGHATSIPARYAGKVVECPACEAVQLALPSDENGFGQAPVALVDGKIPWQCAACSYQAKLGPAYAGKAIRCPGCQEPQVIPLIAVSAALVKPPVLSSVPVAPVAHAAPEAKPSAASATPLADGSSAGRRSVRFQTPLPQTVSVAQTGSLQARPGTIPAPSAIEAPPDSMAGMTIAVGRTTPGTSDLPTVTITHDSAPPQAPTWMRPALAVAAFLTVVLTVALVLVWRGHDRTTAKLLAAELALDETRGAMAATATELANVRQTSAQELASARQALQGALADVEKARAERDTALKELAAATAPATTAATAPTPAAP